MKQLGIPHKEMCWDLQEANEMKIELRIWILQGERDQQTQFNSPLNLTWAIKFVLSDCDSGGPLLITFQNKQTKFIQTRHFIHFLLVWLTIAALVWLNWLTWIKSNVHCIGELQYYDLCTWSLICIIQCTMQKLQWGGGIRNFSLLTEILTILSENVTFTF